jgi:hypothetical protein
MKRSLQSVAVGFTSLVSLSALLLLPACGKNLANSTSDTVDPVEASVESGVSAADGMADDQEGSTYAALRAPSQNLFLDMISIPSAQAAACLRAVSMACNAGVRTSNYTDCSGVNSTRDFNGSVTLTYRQAACTMASNGDTVTRTYNVAITGPRGGVITNSSDAHTNYLGASISGGGRLTKSAAGFDLDIMGKNKIFTRNSRTLFDVSVHTSSPVNVLGSLSRASRTLDGGAIVVDHNLAKFTATFIPSNLQYSASCCHPVSGSMSVTYSGSKTGTGTVTFNGCGTASVNSNGSTQDIALSYCE